MAVYYLQEDYVAFPDPTLADEDGLLAVGGKLSMDYLLLAYTNGIFPWYNPGEIIQWWCPHERFLLYPKDVHISKSMKKYMKKHDISISFNRNFRNTMHQCRMMREEDGTWISDEMEDAYEILSQLGHALGFEVFVDDELAGGLYGVSIGKCFFGESMFSVQENGSKLALILLCHILEQKDYLFVDCQFHTDHLESMGGTYVDWEEYSRLLKEGTSNT